MRQSTSIASLFLHDYFQATFLLFIHVFSFLPCCFFFPVRRVLHEEEERLRREEEERAEALEKQRQLEEKRKLDEEMSKLRLEEARKQLEEEGKARKQREAEEKAKREQEEAERRKAEEEQRKREQEQQLREEEKKRLEAEKRLKEEAERARSAELERLQREEDARKRMEAEARQRQLDAGKRNPYRNEAGQQKRATATRVDVTHKVVLGGPRSTQPPLANISGDETTKPIESDVSSDVRALVKDKDVFDVITNLPALILAAPVLAGARLWSKWIGSDVKAAESPVNAVLATQTEEKETFVIEGGE